MKGKFQVLSMILAIALFGGPAQVAVSENLAFSPDLQYVWNPGGDSDNDGIFAGMLRAEFNF